MRRKIAQKYAHSSGKPVKRKCTRIPFDSISRTTFLIATKVLFVDFKIVVCRFVYEIMHILTISQPQPPRTLSDFVHSCMSCSYGQGWRGWKVHGKRRALWIPCTERTNDFHCDGILWIFNYPNFLAKVSRIRNLIKRHFLRHRFRDTYYFESLIVHSNEHRKLTEFTHCASPCSYRSLLLQDWNSSNQ